jgi:hypothetical protein
MTCPLNMNHCEEEISNVSQGLTILASYKKTGTHSLGVGFLSNSGGDSKKNSSPKHLCSKPCEDAHERTEMPSYLVQTDAPLSGPQNPAAGGP